MKPSENQPKHEYTFAFNDDEFSDETFSTARDAIRAAEFEARREWFEGDRLRIGKVQLIDPPESLMDSSAFVEGWVDKVQNEINAFANDYRAFEQFMPQRWQIEDLASTFQKACSEWLDEWNLRPNVFRVIETRGYIIKNGKARKPK